MPVISTAKPIKITPMFFWRSLFDSICISMPANASSGEKVMGFKRVRKKFSPCTPVRLKSHEVSVVPTFEPIIMPKVSPKASMPEFTRPTSITVIAEDDCMAMVMPAPRKKLAKGFLATFLKSFSSFPPDMLSSPPDIIDIP